MGDCRNSWLGFLMRLLVPGLLAWAIIGIVFLCVDLVGQHVVEARYGTFRAFRLSSSPNFLSDEIAVEKAQATLAQEGRHVGDWVPVRDRRTSAPDGTRDSYLVRDVNPNAGYITFKNGEKQLLVMVELRGSLVICHTYKPK